MKFNEKKFQAKFFNHSKLKNEFVYYFYKKNGQIRRLQVVKIITKIEMNNHIRILYDIYYNNF